MARELRRRTPEELLREAQAEERAASKGYLKIFLGYASGVGKSFRMLDEARRRKERGQDVVVAAVQPGISPEVAALLEKLEVVPLLRIGDGAAVDVERLIRRRPAVCFIDGLAYDNPPGARNRTRWEDARDLLNAGIKVVASINIQYIAELSDRVKAITGKHVTQTVPASFIQSADEVELVDVPPEAPEELPREKAAEGALRQQRMSRLRELALVLTADAVDRQLTDFMESHGMEQRFAAHERILVCMTPRANVTAMMDAARTIADRFHADLIAAYVRQADLSPADQTALDQKLEYARNAGARIEILDGEDPIGLLLEYAHAQVVTQLFIGHSQRRGLWAKLRGTPVDRLIRQSRGMDIRIFPQ